MIPPETMGELYAAFSSESRPSIIPTSMFGIDQEAGAKLLKIPLRDIPWEDLFPYVDHIFYTSGAPADFRYLLPRILELLPEDRGMTWSWDIGRCLGELPWSSLSTDQQSAISKFFFAYLNELLTRERISGSELNSLLCCTSYFLSNWDRVLTEIANRPAALLALMKWNGWAMREDSTPEFRWSDSPKKDAFLRWIRSDEIQVKAWSK